MEAGAPNTTLLVSSGLNAENANEELGPGSSFHHLRRSRPPRRPRWWDIPGLRCGAEERGVGRSWWRRGGGRWERGSAPRGWGCCWGSVWGWWPAACGPCPPSACASVEARGKGQVMWQEHTCRLGDRIRLLSKPTPSPELPRDQTSARSSRWTPWISPPISGWGRCSSPPPSAQTLCSSPPRPELSSSPCPRAPANGTSSPRVTMRFPSMSLFFNLA